MLVVTCNRPGPGEATVAHAPTRGIRAVTASWQHQSEWPGSPEDVHSARDFVVRCLTAHELTRYEPAVSLVASELCTNAVVHARTPFTVSLERRDLLLVMEIRDGASATPAKDALADAEADSGRGLRLVDAFSSSWGVWRRLDGKSVWATFTLRPGELVPGDVYGF